MPLRQLFMIRPRPRRTLLLILIAVFAAEAAVMLILPRFVPPESPVLLVALADACLLSALLVPSLWLLVVTPLARMAQTRQKLLSLTFVVQEDERRRIARDLHDGLGQTVTGLLVGLRALEELSREPEVKAHAVELRRLGGDIHDEIRRLARGLRPAVLDDVGLQPALERLVDDMAAAHGVTCRFEWEGNPQPGLSGEAATAVYRMAQEGVTNALRHGRGTELRVRIRSLEHRLELVIEDNGCGFDPVAALRPEAGHPPFGLLSIRERSWMLGGGTTIESRPGEGTRLTVTIPLPSTETVDGQNARPAG